MQLEPLPSWALVKRELLTTLRGQRSFFILLAFALIAAGYAASNWPADSTYQFRGGVAAAGHASRQLIETFSYILLGGCLFFVPAYAASALVVERERGTYDFLRMSLIRPFGIVIAKLANAVGFFVLILIALAPILAVAFYLVGVDVNDFLMAIAVVLSAAFSAAAVGLVCSAYFRKTFAAIGMSYFGLLLLLFAPTIITFIILGIINQFVTIRSFSGYMLNVARVTCPPLSLQALFDGQLPVDVFASSIAYQIVVAFSLLALTHRRIHIPMNPPKIEQRQPIDDVAELERRRKQFPFYLIDPMRRKKPVEDGRNPMMVREMRWGLFNRGTLYVRVFYIAFVVYFFMGVIASLDARTYDTMGTWLLVQIVVTVVTAPALMANALTKESELGNLDMLRMTLLRPRDIILGKLFAGVVSITPILAAAILSCVPVILIGGVRRWDILAMGYGTLLVCALLSLSIGLFSSLLTRRTSGALAISYVLGILIFGGIALAVEFARAQANQNSLDGWAAAMSPIIEIVSPVTAALSPITGFMSSIRWQEGQQLAIQGVDYSFWTINIAASLALGLAIVAASIQGFNKYKMQDP